MAVSRATVNSPVSALRVMPLGSAARPLIGANLVPSGSVASSPPASVNVSGMVPPWPSGSSLVSEEGTYLSASLASTMTVAFVVSVEPSG